MSVFGREVNITLIKLYLPFLINKFSGVPEPKQVMRLAEDEFCGPNFGKTSRKAVEAWLESHGWQPHKKKACLEETSVRSCIEFLEIRGYMVSKKK